MNKKVLIIKGSPRAEGNTATMADIFAKGAIENHNTVTEIVLKDKTIIDCCGCAICQQNGGKCVQDDDMNEIYDEMYKLSQDFILIYKVSIYLCQFIDRIVSCLQN